MAFDSKRLAFALHVAWVFQDKPPSIVAAFSHGGLGPTYVHGPLSFRTGADVETFDLSLARERPTRRGTASEMRQEGSNYEDLWRQRRVAEMLEEQRELRPQALTELFAPSNLDKLMELNNPDLRFGAVFQLDGVVLDLLPLKRALWSSVAEEFGLPCPSDTQLADSLGLSPHEAVVTCFRWGSRGSEADKYVLAHDHAQQRLLSSLQHEQQQQQQQQQRGGESDVRPTMGAKKGTISSVSTDASVPAAGSPLHTPLSPQKSSGSRWATKKPIAPVAPLPLSSPRAPPSPLVADPAPLTTTKEQQPWSPWKVPSAPPSSLHQTTLSSSSLDPLPSRSRMLASSAASHHRGQKANRFSSSSLSMTAAAAVNPVGSSSVASPLLPPSRNPLGESIGSNSDISLSPLQVVQRKDRPVNKNKTSNRWSKQGSVAATSCSKESIEMQLPADTILALKSTTAVPGFTQWLDQLRSHQVPVAVVSAYPRSIVQSCLEAAGLWGDFFEESNGAPLFFGPDGSTVLATSAKEEETVQIGVVSSPDEATYDDLCSCTDAGAGRVSDSSRGWAEVRLRPVDLMCGDGVYEGHSNPTQLFLAASLKLGRAPSRCAVFDSSPKAMTNAHEADMRGCAVLDNNMRGSARPFDFGAADLLCHSLDELSLSHLRGLFSDRADPFGEEVEPELLPDKGPQRNLQTLQLSKAELDVDGGGQGDSGRGVPRQAITTKK